jgi:beta-xylosidase
MIKPYLIVLPFLSGILFANELPQNGWAHNPIIWADVPDMAMIRVDDTYYMCSTTMHMSPGLPIMKSKDLVNWKLLNYAYDTLAENDALTLQDGQNAYGAGSWASSLRYHNGLFYVTTFSSTTDRTHIYTTADIENGQWSACSFEPRLHDTSLFFDDDGRVYMIYGAGDIKLVELTADATAIKPGSEEEVIIPNASLVAGPNVGLGAEGSQLFKVDGKYYLFNITWPKNDMRTVLVHRADKITGPYEGRVVFKDRGIAQGGLIDTPEGDWYAYLFEDHGAVGRIPYLVPVTWQDGWPVLGVEGKAPEILEIPAPEDSLAGIVRSDEFDRNPDEPELPLAWQWNHNPDNRHWSLDERPGYLRLKSARLDAELLQARNTLTQRTFGPESSAHTRIDVSHMKEGDYAGLTALQKNYGFIGVKAEQGSKWIVMVRPESEKPYEVQKIAFDGDVVFLKVSCDFRNLKDTAYFYYSLDGETWIEVGEPLHMVYTLPHFMGYRFGLFYFSTRSPGGYVDFDYFRLVPKIQVPTNAL